jgi:methionyl-tRNA formyltransferase
MRVHIATSRPIGEKCLNWAKGLADMRTMDDCEVFISVLYDQIIPKEFIDKHRCFNFHPGILPGYRGSGAYSWALINKEKHAGVTLHEIDEDIDTGPIIDVRTFSISEKDTAYTLYSQAEEVIFEMFKDWFMKLLLGKYRTFGQSNHGVRTYYRKDLEKAKDLTHIVKAFTFPGKENAFYFNKKGEKIPLVYEDTV